ncbi:Signal peptidase I [Cryptosporidium meleagridis]
MEFIIQAKNEAKQILSKPHQTIYQCLTLACIVLSALMLWRGLMVATNSQSPVVVVLSGSMEPGFYRGDILFLYNRKSITIGDIVVFSLEGRDIPIVHRVLSYHEGPNDGEVSILTKGDNNDVDDRGLYNENQFWLNNKHIMGTAVGIIPKVGMITIWLNDYPWLKYALVGMMGITVLLGKE